MFLAVGKSGIPVELGIIFGQGLEATNLMALSPRFERGPFRWDMMVLITTLDCVGHEYENAREIKVLKGR